MKTYKIVYSILDQPGQKVTFVQAWNEIDAKFAAYKEQGGTDSFDTKMSIWEVKELK